MAFNRILVFAQAQSQRSLPQPLCEKKGIKFPIDDLGGCKDYFSCRNYCSNPQNQDKCGAFAGKKNITAKDVAETEEFVRFENKVSKEFGCYGREACKIVCDNPENFTKCDTLAKAAKIVGGFIDNPGNQDIINQAKHDLGCKSEAECKTFCDKEENKAKCSEFAKGVGLSGGEVKVGPGSCKSVDTCQDFCKDPKNARECNSFGFIKNPKESVVTTAKNEKPGPGGCKSETECTTYCTQNPTNSECRKYSDQNGFKGPGGCSTNDACAAYCTQNYQDPECQKSGSISSFKGPGGCTDQASCTAYCTSNYQDAECLKYSGQNKGGFKGPGGCSDEASCASFCKSNYKDPECQKFSGQFGGNQSDMMQQYGGEFSDQQGQQQNQQGPQQDQQQPPQ